MDLFEGDVFLMVVGLFGTIMLVLFFTVRWWADWAVQKWSGFKSGRKT